ncbi:MAG: hypothetical protein WC714_15435 [Candidatus Obscuribacterales bacterium]
MILWKKTTLFLAASFCGFISWQSFLANEDFSVCAPPDKPAHQNTPVVLVLSSKPGRFNVPVWQPLCSQNQLLALCSNRNVKRAGWGSLVLADLNEFQRQYANDGTNLCLFGYRAGGRAAYFLTMREPMLASKLIVSDGVVPAEFRTYVEKNQLALSALKNKSLVMLTNTACSDINQQMQKDKQFLEEKLQWKITLIAYEDQLARTNSLREAPKSIYQQAIQLAYQR